MGLENDRLLAQWIRLGARLAEVDRERMHRLAALAAEVVAAHQEHADAMITASDALSRSADA